MRYFALACDYDETLASRGCVDERTLDALGRLRETGRRLILVTGRRLEELQEVCPEYGLFDRIVAENGARLFAPETREDQLLTDPPSDKLVLALRDRGVTPLSVGRVIVATREPHQSTVLETIRDLGLELQVIFNKGAVMVLPSGINKATGLHAALADLRISPHSTIAVGDAENDHALLAASEVGVAVENALPMLKERADLITSEARGDGVVELVDEILSTDLRGLEPALARWSLSLGELDDGSPLCVHAYGRRLLVCGSSGSGKSTLATSFLEQLSAKHYQFCLIDPEGDYDGLEHVIAIGDEQQVPRIEEVSELVSTTDGSVTVNLLAVPLDRRPAFLTALLGRLADARSQLGRPHWLIIDEAHHTLPKGSVTLPNAVSSLPPSCMLITVQPEHLPTSVLTQIDGLIVVGNEPEHTIARFARARGEPRPSLPSTRLSPGVGLYWSKLGDQPIVRFRVTPPKTERHRHQRKYAAGELSEEESFYFRGPRNALRLRAQNLVLFLQIADGIDDETWLHHLAKHDYSAWIRKAIKNPSLAAEVERIEHERSDEPQQSRTNIRGAIERVYMLPV